MACSDAKMTARFEAAPDPGGTLDFDAADGRHAGRTRLVHSVVSIAACYVWGEAR